MSDATGNVVVVAGGKGGVGASTVAALVGVAAAVAGRRTLLVDCDARVGALHLMLGVAPRSLGELRGGALEASDLVAEIAGTLHVVSGAAADADGVPPAEARALAGRVAELFDSYELVVIDAGSRLESVLGACAHAGRLLVVTTADAIAAAAGYALLKMAAERHPTLSTRVVANRHDERGGPGDGLISSAAAHFLGREAPVAAAVPEDSLLARAVGAGMTVQDAADGSPAAHAVAVATARLLDELDAGDRRAIPAARAAYAPIAR